MSSARIDLDGGLDGPPSPRTLGSAPAKPGRSSVNRLTRLFDMAPAEVVVRARQALHKRLDRVLDARAAIHPGRDVVHLAAFRRSAGERFFAGAAADTAPSLPPA